MPLDFMKRFLEQEGGLVEARDEALETVLPDSLRAALGLADESAAFTLEGRSETIACGYGTELLRTACARAIGEGRVAVARAPFDRLRTNGAVGRPGPLPFSGLNVALRPGEPEPSEVWTVEAWLRVDASADDRRVLAVAAAVALEAEPVAIVPPAWSAALDACPKRPPSELLARAEAALALAARAAALEATAPFREAVARRARRDVERIDRYFAELDADLAARVARAPKGAAGLESKRALLPEERERRLRTLRENAVVRVQVEPVALRAVLAPAARATLEVLRRKARRRLSVVWHPALREWIPLGCEGCGASVRSFGGCDDSVHVLCEECLGAKSCPRCARGGPAPGCHHEEHAAREEAIELPPGGEPLPLSAPRATERVPRAAEKAPPPTPMVAKPAAPAASASLVDRVSGVLRSSRGALSSEQLQARCGLSASEALRAALATLVREGRVERTGKARGTRYRWQKGP